jgi:hypothetical protein
MPSSQPRCCVISLATDRKRFPEALERLRESLRRVDFRGDVVFWTPGTYPAGCPQHLEVPFAFKPFCFTEAGRRGYDLVLWLDAACVAIRSLDPIFAAMNEQGYALFRNRAYKVGQWASDEALRIFGLSRDGAMQLGEVNAAAIGLSLHSRVGREFLDGWLRAATEGTAFRGIAQPIASWREYNDVKWNRARKVSADPRVRGHRHDQTVAGIIAHRLGMTLSGDGPQSYSSKHRHIKRNVRIVIDRDVGKPERDLAPLGRIARDKYLGIFFARRR